MTTNPVSFGYSKHSGVCSQCRESVGGESWSWEGMDSWLYPLCYRCFDLLFDRQECRPRADVEASRIPKGW